VPRGAGRPSRLTRKGPFPRRRGVLHAGEVSLPALADSVGTPAYVYVAESFRERYRAVREAFSEFDVLVCYSVKSNGNLAVLSLLAAEGAGFDVVSAGELWRVRRAGGDPSKVAFAGVGKTDEDLLAALDAAVFSVQVESETEVGRLDGLARARGSRARVALRVNPGVEARTHPAVATGGARAKFGVDLPTARRLLRGRERFPNLEFVGLHAHVGSQIFEPSTYVRTIDRLATLAPSMPAGRIPHVDLGGGFGADPATGRTLDLRRLADAVGPRLRRLGSRLLLEPGRWISGPSGVLLTRVLDVKRSRRSAFAVVDAGMNDFLRPALYGAVHPIVRVDRGRGRARRFDVVGPVCETGDVLGRGRLLAEPKPGDLLAVLDAGAYGFSMASNYNGRPRPAEVLVEGGAFRVVRERESLDDLVRGEGGMEREPRGRIPRGPKY